MRVIVTTAALACLIMPTAASATSRHRHSHASHIARGWHIPRFDQREAEAYVHTVYPYRTGLYVPWPDAYGAPYPY